MSLTLKESTSSDLHNVAIDNVVSRRPPSRKHANDQANYPMLIELLLNSSEYASQQWYEITGGKLESSRLVTDANDFRGIEINSVVYEFRSGFRAALRDLKEFHMFLLTLHQKLDGVLQALLNVVNRSSGDLDKEDPAVPESPAQAKGTEVPLSIFTKQGLDSW